MGDERGAFLEWFKDPVFTEAVGHRLDLVQANASVSAKGVLRGIHFADVPPGQAKYVTCVKGSVLDVIVDIRVGSPTFGQWTSVLLDDRDRRAVYLSEGLGHGFCSLEDGSTVVYLCSEGYNPSGEHEVHPLDPAIGIEWPLDGGRAGAVGEGCGCTHPGGGRGGGAPADYDECRHLPPGPGRLIPQPATSVRIRGSASARASRQSRIGIEADLQPSGRGRGRCRPVVGRGAGRRPSWWDGPARGRRRSVGRSRA